MRLERAAREPSRARERDTTATTTRERDRERERQRERGRPRENEGVGERCGVHFTFALVVAGALPDCGVGDRCCCDVNVNVNVDALLLLLADEMRPDMADN